MIHALRGSVRLLGGLHSIHLQMDAGARVDDHYHGLPTFVLVVRGEMQVRIGDDITFVPAHSVQLVAPGTVRTVVAGSDGVECIVVTAAIDQGVGAHRVWRRNGARVVLEGEIPDVWPPLLAAAMDCNATSPALERVLLTLLQYVADDGSSPGTVPWLARALEILDVASGHAGAARELADTLGLHRVHVARVVHQQEGMTLRELVRRTKVTRAESLIRNTEWPLSQVAHAAGFADHAHMCREFARRVGISPGEYRARLRTASRANAALVQAQPFPAAHFGVAGDTSNSEHPAIGP